jgi:hypothetical protein
MFFDAAGATVVDALAAVEKSQVFFSGITPLLHDGTHINPEPDVRLMNDASGDLLDIFTVTGVVGVTGGNPGNYVGPAGACVNWLTQTVNGGRRMTGRTFLVPCSTATFDTDGTILQARVADMQLAAQSFIDAIGPTFGVYGRPVKADPDATPPVVARLGKWGAVTSHRPLDKAVVLRSRRD